MIEFIVEGNPIAKPRQTRADRWNKRDCVIRYRSWADKARGSAPRDYPKSPKYLLIKAYFAIPKSLSKKKQRALVGQLHRNQPDWDNVAKAVCDALWKRDQMIAVAIVVAKWDDGKGPRTEIYVE